MKSPPAGAGTQLRLALRRQPSFERAPFIVSDRNREAVGALDAWPDWPGGRLALIGPEASGKSHLARRWATRTGAFVADAATLDLAELSVGAILLEDVDRAGVADDALFHLINRADAGGSLLMTARTPPRLWPAQLPDLRSRLNALFAVEIFPPDDAVLEGLLLRFFRDRHIRPDPDLLSYLFGAWSVRRPPPRRWSPGSTRRPTSCDGRSPARWPGKSWEPTILADDVFE